MSCKSAVRRVSHFNLLGQRLLFTLFVETENCTLLKKVVTKIRLPRKYWNRVVSCRARLALGLGLVLGLVIRVSFSVNSNPNPNLTPKLTTRFQSFLGNLILEYNALSVLMLCAPVFIFKSGSSFMAPTLCQLWFTVMCVATTS